MDMIVIILATLYIICGLINVFWEESGRNKVFDFLCWPFITLWEILSDIVITIITWYKKLIDKNR